MPAKIFFLLWVVLALLGAVLYAHYTVPTPAQQCLQELKAIRVELKAIKGQLDPAFWSEFKQTLDRN